MKKIKIRFIAGDDDGYTEVSGGDRYPKWDFKVQGEGEFVLMERRSLPQKKGGGTFDLYTVIEKNTKKVYCFFCGKVLEDKLKNIPLFSLVKVKFEGVHATKGYHLYKVFQNTNFRYDPAQFTLDNYVEAKADDATTTSSPSTSVGNKAQQTTQVDEDLPF